MRTVHPQQWAARGERYRAVGAPRGLGPRETRVRASLAAAAGDLWRSGPVRGQRYVQEAENTRLRMVYICVLTSAVACGAAVLWAGLSARASRHPATTSELAGGRRLRFVDFPAVALCAANLISRTALQDFAKHLSERDGNRTFSRQEVERHLAALGALSEMTRASGGIDVRFVGFLAALGYRNVSDIAYRLSPRCSSLLVRCTWRARVVPCDRVFAARATPHGYCCTFNARYQAEDARRPALRLAAAGRNEGLGVVVHQDSADFAYVRRATAGLEVMIWEGTEYPVPEGGGMAVHIARINASVYLTVSARELHAHSSLRELGDRQRGCRMPPSSGAAARDSLAWCMVNCRVAAVRVLCACTPHLYTPLYPDDEYETCSLDHLDCLSKYREKLQSYSTVARVQAGAVEEEIGLLCLHCNRDCARLQYMVHSAHSEYRHLRKLFKNRLSRNISFVNTSVIRVYFTRSDQDLLVTEVVERWFQRFAMLSSEVVCVAGVTVVTALQLLYHAGPRWWHHYRRRAHPAHLRAASHKEQGLQDASGAL